MVQAASTWSGDPLAYRQVTISRADTSLQEIRSRALSGQLTTDDVLRAAAQIKAVQENAPAVPAADHPAPAVPSSPIPGPEPSSYTRAETDFQLPINDAGYPLSSSRRAQLDRILDRFPLRHLSVISEIRILPPASDPQLGQFLVRTDGQRMTLYGAADLKEAATEGIALLVYESMRGSPLEKEWGRYGDMTDFIQTYSAWMDNTRQAFEDAQQPGQPAGELSKLFFVAPLFDDSTGDKITVYDPAPQEVALQAQEEGHYGFGPYSFDIYHNRIVHLAMGGVSSTASAAADIPALWAQQGLGN